MTKEDITEMRMAAAAAVGLFPRIEIDPAHAVELCNLALLQLGGRDLVPQRSKEWWAKKASSEGENQISAGSRPPFTRAEQAGMARDAHGELKGLVPWPSDQPQRFNASNEPCDMWTGPCSCGAWHNDGR